MMFNERGRLGKVDSRVKITWLLATLVAGLIFAQPLSLLVILASIIAVAAIGGVLRETFRRMRGLAVIIIMIGLIFGLTVPGTPVLHLIPATLPIGPALAISQEGL